MAHEKISEKDRVLLVRALGLLVNQAGIYGPTHNVTKSAARSVFAEVETMTRQYGVIEIAVKEKRLFVNGSADGLDDATIRNLRDKLVLNQLGGVVFSPPAEMSEFMTCVSLFGTPPGKLAELGGLETAIRQAGLKSIRTVNVNYPGVSGAAAAVSDAVPSAKAQEHYVPSTKATGVLDLSSALAHVDEGVKDDSVSEHAKEQDPAAARRKQRASELAALLRDAAVLLERDMASEAMRQCQVVETLAHVRDVLAEATRDSEQQITSLADQVDEDRQTIASIESAARRRGIGLKLTRGELVERYAELNQEIVQPLTVSTGVIDMLHSGHGGPLTEAQRDMLKLASDSVERVNQLVAYMSKIAGLPGSCTPDAGIINDTYRR